MIIKGEEEESSCFGTFSLNLKIYEREVSVWFEIHCVCRNLNSILETVSTLLLCSCECVLCTWVLYYRQILSNFCKGDDAMMRCDDTQVCECI